MLRKSTDPDLAVAIAKHVEYRREKYGSDPYLIFERTGDVTEFRKDEEVSWLSDTDGRVQFWIYFHVVLPGAVVGVTDEQVAAGIAALAVANDGLYEAQRVADDVIFYADDGTPAYTYSPRTFAAGFQSLTLLDAKAADVDKWFAVLARNESLRRAVRLVLWSLESTADNLRAFIGAWLALELFTQKAYKRYRPNKARRGLAERFAIVAGWLSPDTAPEDAQLFTRFKAEREKVFHGYEFNERSLPTSEVRTLFWKYLRLHLTQLAAPVRPRLPP